LYDGSANSGRQENKIKCLYIYFVIYLVKVLDKFVMMCSAMNL